MLQTIPRFLGIPDALEGVAVSSRERENLRADLPREAEPPLVPLSESIPPALTQESVLPYSTLTQESVLPYSATLQQGSQEVYGATRFPQDTSNDTKEATSSGQVLSGDQGVGSCSGRRP